MERERQQYEGYGFGVYSQIHLAFSKQDLIYSEFQGFVFLIYLDLLVSFSSCIEYYQFHFLVTVDSRLL